MPAESALLTRFYDALARRDPETMIACYHAEATFTDPVFGRLDRARAAAMWRMLLEQGKDLVVTADGIESDGTTGRARWTATYSAPPAGRTVRNRIQARFRFRDGLIVEHVDSFSLWKWAGMAIGPVGWLLGWTPMVRGRIRRRARRSLARYERRAPG